MLTKIQNLHPWMAPNLSLGQNFPKNQNQNDAKEEANEDKLRSGKKLSSVITTSAKPSVKAKVKKKSWWWRKERSKTWKKKKKKKKTVSMHRHHHATFAHLTHDALLRLKCSPIHRSGHSHKQILQNIEKHYKSQLGKEFKVRLQLTLEKLVKKGLLTPVGSKKNGQKYKPSEAFLAQFVRLKVVDGASNHQFGLVIHKYRRSRGNNTGSRNGITSRSCKRRGRRRRRRREVGQTNGREQQQHGRSHHHQWSKSKWHSRKSHSSEEADSKNKSSSNFWGSSMITKWLWSSKEDKGEEDKNEKFETLNEERKTDFSKRLMRKLKSRLKCMPATRKKKCKSGRGSSSPARGARYRRFNRIRIREYAEKPVLPSLKESVQWSETRYETPPTSLTIDEDMSDSTLDGSTPIVEDKSRKEHDILHSIKEGSAAYPTRRSFLEKVGDTLRGTFGY